MGAEGDGVEVAVDGDLVPPAVEGRPDLDLRREVLLVAREVADEDLHRPLVGGPDAEVLEFLPVAREAPLVEGLRLEEVDGVGPDLRDLAPGPVQHAVEDVVLVLAAVHHPPVEVKDVLDGDRRL